MKKRRAVCARAVLRFLLVMKLSLIFVLIFTTQAHSTGFSQDRINLSLKNVEMKTAIIAIQRISFYRFLYNDDILPKDRNVTVDARNATIQQVLNDIFLATPLTYRIMNEKLIVISSNEKAAAPPVTGVIQLRDQAGGTTTTAGVVVREVGTNNATVTNDRGQFTINVTDANARLEISHVGYRTVIIPVDGNNSITQVLEAEVQQLTDVVVTALGITRQKKALTYSTQTIKGSDLSDSRNMNVTNAMTGRIAGLTINKTNSGPGGSNRIIFRGNRSISGNNQPLIIVDGVRIDNDPKAFADVPLFGGRDNGDGISNLNPDDIESMSVLTGASASALYGSDAANGAIIITTKKGKAGRGIGVSITSSATIEKPMLLPGLQNLYGQGFAGTFNDASELSWGAKMEGQEVTDWTGKTQPLTPQTDNVNDFFQTGNEFLNSAAFSTGTEKGQTYFSYTNTLSRGIIPNNDYRRNNFNLRQTMNLTDKLSVDLKANYIIENIGNRPLSGLGNKALSTLYTMPRSLRLDDIRNFEAISPSGALVQNYWSSPNPNFQNPLWSVHRNLYERDRNRIIGLAAAKYQFMPELSVQIRSSIDYYVDAGEEKIFTNTFGQTDGNYVVSRESNRQFNGDVLVNYIKDLSQSLQLNVNAGAGFEKFNFERATLNNNGLIAPNLFATSNAKALSDVQFPYSTYRPLLSRTERHSVYAAAQLSYNNYLFLDLTGRNDWNSTLPPKNASLFFPSAGISAVISDIVSLPNFLPYLKARTSYSFVANGTGFNQLKPSFRLVPGGNGGFLIIDPTLRNPDLLPEQTRSFEAGIDFSLFANRIAAEITWYNTNTVNQSLAIPVPQPSGYANRFINLGDIRNRGIELVLFGKPIAARDFKWNINLTFGANRNKVIRLDSLNKKPLLSSPQDLGLIQVIEGGKFGELTVRGFVRDDAGQIVVKEDGLPVYNEAQETYAGNYNPDWTGGISNNFQFKSFTLSFLIDARKGGKVISGTRLRMAEQGTADFTATNRETPFVIPNSVMEDGSKNSVQVTSEQYWRHITSNLIVEPFVYDATNVRMREASITYALPQGILGNSVVTAASLSLVGRNLFFIRNKADGIDPEIALGTGNNQGIEYISIPTTRSLGIYLKLNF